MSLVSCNGEGIIRESRGRRYSQRELCLNQGTDQITTFHFKFFSFFSFPVHSSPWNLCFDFLYCRIARVRADSCHIPSSHLIFFLLLRSIEKSVLMSINCTWASSRYGSPFITVEYHIRITVVINESIVVPKWRWWRMADECLPHSKSRSNHGRNLLPARGTVGHQFYFWLR